MNNLSKGDVAYISYLLGLGLLPAELSNKNVLANPYTQEQIFSVIIQTQHKLNSQRKLFQ